MIFVGNLPDDVKEREVEDIFAKYGKIIVVHTPPSSILEIPFDLEYLGNSPSLFLFHQPCNRKLHYRYFDRI